MTLIASLFVGCGDDDDDDGISVGGTSTGQGGTSQNGNGGEGDTSTAARGGSAGRPSTGGSSGTGGSVAIGGSLAQGGQGGFAGVSVSEGGVAGEMLGGAGGMGGSVAGAGGQLNAAAELSDAQILLVLDTLNAGEVEESYAALPHLTSPDVVMFAQRMVQDHSSARQSVLTTSNNLDLEPEPSSVQEELEQEAQAHVADFRHGSGSLDEPYMQVEVTGHAEALELLATLREAADAAALRTLITNLETTVQAHYDSAVAIRAAL